MAEWQLSGFKVGFLTDNWTAFDLLRGGGNV